MDIVVVLQAVTVSYLPLQFDLMFRHSVVIDI